MAEMLPAPGTAALLQHADWLCQLDRSSALSTDDGPESQRTKPPTQGIVPLAELPAPEALFRGRGVDLFVRDEFGLALAAAEIELVMPAKLRSSVGLVLEHSAQQLFRCSSKEDGSFEFSSFPAVPGSSLRVKPKGFDTYLQPGSMLHDEQHLVTLRRPSVTPTKVSGKVLDEQGAPVEGALVSLGLACTQSASENAELSGW
jgi:hypothetical protein